MRRVNITRRKHHSTIMNYICRNMHCVHGVHIHSGHFFWSNIFTACNMLWHHSQFEDGTRYCCLWFILRISYHLTQITWIMTKNANIMRCIVLCCHFGILCDLEHSEMCTMSLLFLFILEKLCYFFLPNVYLKDNIFS